MKRVERLFAIAEVLRARRTGITAEALAEQFHVTVRTIYRDLDSLRLADMPVGAERGRGGGYALDRSYSLPPVNFTAREAALLTALGRHATEMRLLPFTETLGSALEKVRGALSASAQRELLSRLDEVTFIGVPAMPVNARVRAAIERAWFESSPLSITYLDRSSVESKRTIKLVRVTSDRHETLLTAVDVATNERRTFRLHQIVRAQVPAQRSLGGR